MSKRKRRNKHVLSLEERVAVITDYASIRNARILAKKYGCGRTQIQNIIKARRQLVSQYNRNPDTLSDKSHLYEIADSMGVVLYEWIQRSRAQGLEITQPLLENVAGNIAPLLGLQEYRPEPGWLKTILKKYNCLAVDSSENLNDGGTKSLKYTDIMDELGIKYVIPAGMEYYNYTLPSQLDSFPANYNAVTPQLSSTDGSFESPQLEDSSTVETIIIDGDGDSESDDMTSEAASTSNAATDSASEVNSYREALNVLGPLERFTLLRGNIRAVGLINQLENLFRDELEKILQDQSKT